MVQYTWTYFLASAIWIFSAWRWSDWRNWKKYHSTILFVIAVDMMHNFLLDDYELWMYGPRHVYFNLLFDAVIFPCTILLYLTHFPHNRFGKMVLYVLMWVALYSVIEWFYNHVLYLFTYHHGWRLEYTVLFNIVMFSMMRLHFRKPLLAYSLVPVFTVIILLAFDVPVSKWK